MTDKIDWQAFADATIDILVKPAVGDTVLIITDTEDQTELPVTCLKAALRAGADAQLLVKQHIDRKALSTPGPVLSDAILASKFIVDFCGGIVRAPATIEARSRGSRLLSTYVNGIEDYVNRALLNIDYEAMIRNADLVAKLWDNTNYCHVTSPQGTDISFKLMPRTSKVGDGALTEDGEVDFFPGAQVSIAPIEETINGTIVVDASDNLQGVVKKDYSLRLKDGVITEIEGEQEGDFVREWLETCNDDKVYKLCHFTIGLNPQAGISGNLMEDERKLAAVDFGFGYQDPSFGGNVGLSPYHWDVMLACPTIYLDEKEMSGRESLNPDLGFIDM